MPLISFPSIESFYQVRKGVERYPSLVTHPLTYYPKMKLHGTNAGVQIHPNGDVIAQSRQRIIVPGDDNYGFARWVKDNEAFFSEHKSDRLFTLFGEWCGPGIAKKTAINQIQDKIFAVFMLQLGDSIDDADVVVQPDRLRSLIRDHPSIYIIEWLNDYQVMVDWHDQNSLQTAVDHINKAIAQVCQCDPFVQKIWGIEGIGEGLVYYPIEADKRKMLADLMFKAKGEEHKATGSKKAAQIAPDVLESIEEFVSYFVTVPRLEQGLMEVCQGNPDIKSIGSFLAWVGRDIEKESKLELAESGLEWKQVNKFVAIAAKNWFIDRLGGKV